VAVVELAEPQRVLAAQVVVLTAETIAAQLTQAVVVAVE
jgi:hypothetical protein